MIKLTKKAIELLDAVTSVPNSRKGLGYTIGRGLDAILPFTCFFAIKLFKYGLTKFSQKQTTNTKLARINSLRNDIQIKNICS
jgi:hypothetical protein